MTTERAVAQCPRCGSEIVRVTKELRLQTAEMNSFLKAKEERDRVMQDTCNVIRETWSACLTKGLGPSDRVLIPWITTYGAEEINASIEACIPGYMGGKFGFDGERTFKKIVPYIGAILRNRQSDKEDGAID